MDKKEWRESGMSQKIKKETKRIKINEGIDSPVVQGDKIKFLKRDVKRLLIFFLWFVGLIIILLYNWK